MTFKEELEKILRDLHGYEVPLTGEVTLDADLDYQNKLVTREIDQALTSIINLVDKEVTKARINELEIILNGTGHPFAIPDECKTRIQRLRRELL